MILRNARTKSWTLFAILMIALVAVAAAPFSRAAGPNGGGGGDKKPAGAPPQPGSPAAAYVLQGDFGNSGIDSTSFTSSDTAWGSVGAWRFYASGAGETALR